MAHMKSILVPAAALIVVGGAATAIMLTKQPEPNTSVDSAKTADPGKSQDQVKEYSPTDIVKQLSQYNNQRLTLKGSINQLPSKEYYVVGEGNPPGAIKLDFSKSRLDPTKYSNTSEDVKYTGGKPPTLKGSFSVTGKLARPATSGPYVLIVESIK